MLLNDFVDENKHDDAGAEEMGKFISSFHNLLNVQLKSNQQIPYKCSVKKTTIMDYLVLSFCLILILFDFFFEGKNQEEKKKKLRKRRKRTRPGKKDDSENKV